MTAGVAVRMVADAIIISGVLAATFFARLLWTLVVERPSETHRETTARFVAMYASTIWIILPIALVVFWLVGLYTATRAYSLRYKALAAVQAVSVAYLVFAFVAFALRLLGALPRTVLVAAWVLTCCAVVGVRMWSALWRKILTAEASLPARGVARSEPTRILLVGGAGYIGSALLPMLLEQGYKVRLLDLLLFGDEPIRARVGNPNLELVRADFRQVDRVVETMEGVGAVIHLGGIVGDPACAVDERLTIEVNLTATRMLAEVAKGSGVQRFFFASTCSVYGASDEVLDERSQLNPVSLYAKSKIASERVLGELANGGFFPVTLRIATIYGLSGRPRFDLVVNLMVAQALARGEITVFGGEQWRPFVHVEDAARAMLMAVEAPPEAVGGRIFNVGSDDQNHTIQQIAEMVQRTVPRAKIVYRGADLERRNYRVQFARIRRVLRFLPSWTLERGIAQVADSIRSGRVADVFDPLHSNAKFLTEDSTSALIRNYYSGWEQRLIAQPGGEQPSAGADLVSH
jgi:nucleoside-diphosphate-sugar epimerase